MLWLGRVLQSEREMIPDLSLGSAVWEGKALWRIFLKYWRGNIPWTKDVENEITLLSPKPKFPEACRNCGHLFKYTPLYLLRPVLPTQYCSYLWWTKDWEPSFLGKEVLARTKPEPSKQLSRFREWNVSRRCSIGIIESTLKRWGQFP